MTTGKLEWVSKAIDGHIASFDRKAQWYRRVYFGTSMTILLLSAAITLISAWNAHGPQTQSFASTYAVIVLSTLATVITGLGFFHSPKNSWLLFASATNQLRALRAKIRFAKAGAAISSDDEDRLATEINAQVQAILDALNKAWLALRSSSAPTATLAKPQEEKTVGHGAPPVINP